jgi:hypothetical protein
MARELARQKAPAAERRDLVRLQPGDPDSLLSPRVRTATMPALTFHVGGLAMSEKIEKPEKPAAKDVQLQIELDEQTAQGAYCNLAMVNHTPTEFTMDFIYVQPQLPKAKVRSRIITSPQHMKRLLLALQDNIARYERSFGPISLANLPEGPVH